MKDHKLFLVVNFISVIALAIFFVEPTDAKSLAQIRDGNIIFVDLDATGLNNGSSWEDAFTDLQTALTAAATGSEIWVAEGTYYPTATTERSISFSMKNGVAIYGGFEGTELARNVRDWVAHPTILSGDIGSHSSSLDNSYHVIYNSSLDSTAILDGFTITRGRGREDFLNGAGMYNDSSSPILRNLIFKLNSADCGGGIYNYQSSPTITNAIFIENYARDFGGGLCNYMSSPTFTDVTFLNNTADGWGGGGMGNKNSNPILTGGTFSGNSSPLGGGGGGIFNLYESSPILTNVTIYGNSASFGGGIENSDSSDPTLTNVTISGNTAFVEGGGIDNDYVCNPTLINVILWGNSAPAGAGIMNTASTAQISYSDVQGCGGSSSWDSGCGVDGGGNIAEDPLLGPLADNGGFTQTHALQSGSPAIDAGSPTIYPVTDQRGITRPVDGDGDGTAICDMGAYEVSMLLYVDLDATGLNNGSSWEDAFTDLQAALTAAVTGSEIWVAEGTYYPTATTDRSISFTLKNGVAIYGGFEGTELARDVRDWVAHPTILSGDIGSHSSSLDNSYHVIHNIGIDSTAILDGFTITRGRGLENALNGAGMYNDSSSPILRNLIFKMNSADYGGGIMNLNSSSPTITNAIFMENYSEIDGGGIYNVDGSSVTITNAIFYQNSANRGGGLYCSGTCALINCTMHGNQAFGHGGGIYNPATGTLTGINCILWGNTTSQIEGSGSVSITYSIVQDSPVYPGVGNKNGDPLFIDGPNGDLHLQAGSPAIDAGNNAAVPTGVLTDLDGNTRFVDYDNSGTAEVDMGAYEAKPPSSILQVCKVFNPLESGFTGTFTITYDCDDGTDHDGTLLLAAGQSATINGIPVGTICTVSEDTLPIAPMGWRFETPIINPQDGVVTLVEDDQVYVVTVTNSIISQFKLFLPLIIGN